MATDHHLLHNGVAAQDVVLPRVLLDKVLHPGGLTCAWQADHHDDLHTTRALSQVPTLKEHL